MENIELAQTPNQSMTVSRDDHVYEISFRAYGGITLVTVVKDDETVVRSLPCVIRGWFIPYEYQVGDGGNFRFEGNTEDYPVYSEFGSAVNLVYHTHEEYEELKKTETE